MILLQKNAVFFYYINNLFICELNHKLIKINFDRTCIVYKLTSFNMYSTVVFMFRTIATWRGLEPLIVVRILLFRSSIIVS